MGGMQEIVADLFDVTADATQITPQESLVKAAKLGREGILYLLFILFFLLSFVLLDVRN